MAIAGRVAIVPKGDWSADATYKRLDAVTYNNTLYFAKKDVPAGTATSNTEYWSKSIVGGVGAIAKPEEAGIVKPDGKSMSVDESGTLSINLDGTTITLDEAKNVIKLADTLKDKIGSALQPESIVNNQTTTEEGFALDARQANPNINGTLAKQISDLNGSLQYTEYINKLTSIDVPIYFSVIYKYGRIVQLIMQLGPVSANSEVTVTTLPEETRPYHEMYRNVIAGVPNGSGDNYFMTTKIKETGEVLVQNFSGYTTTETYIDVMYFG